MSAKPVLYIGDDSIDGAASYLAGVMHRSGIEFDYRGSTEDATDLVTGNPHQLFILSDYPSLRLGDENARHITDEVGRGAGLLMIGGWESFHGAGGDYDSSPIAEALPVTVSGTDDRMNWWGPCVVRKCAEHEICNDIAFNPAPVVGGFNRIAAGEDSVTVLEVERYTVAAETRLSRAPEFTLLDTHPLLVTGRHGDGRVAAFATDAAPHWVGGFVDWGDSRITVMTDDFEIEVGDRYVAFFTNLLRWCANISGVE